MTENTNHVCMSGCLRDIEIADPRAFFVTDSLGVLWVCMEKEPNSPESILALMKLQQEAHAMGLSSGETRVAEHSCSKEELPRLLGGFKGGS